MLESGEIGGIEFLNEIDGGDDLGVGLIESVMAIESGVEIEGVVGAGIGIIFFEILLGLTY